MREGAAVVVDYGSRKAAQDAATDAFLQALALVPTDGDTWNDLGTSLFFAGELSDAAQVYRIGHALAVRQEMVWRVEVDEKPDIVWDRPDLERLWLRLSDEYDLGERYRALGRKIELLDESASSLLAVLQSNRAHHAEQAIIWLIVFEIGLTLFEMWH